MMKRLYTTIVLLIAIFAYMETTPIFAQSTLEYPRTTVEQLNKKCDCVLDSIEKYDSQLNELEWKIETINNLTRELEHQYLLKSSLDSLNSKIEELKKEKESLAKGIEFFRERDPEVQLANAKNILIKPFSELTSDDFEKILKVDGIDTNRIAVVKKYWELYTGAKTELQSQQNSTNKKNQQKILEWARKMGYEYFDKKDILKRTLSEVQMKELGELDDALIRFNSTF